MSDYIIEILFKAREIAWENLFISILIYSMKSRANRNIKYHWKYGGKIKALKSTIYCNTKKQQKELFFRSWSNYNYPTILSWCASGNLMETDR